MPRGALSDEVRNCLAIIDLNAGKLFGLKSYKPIAIWLFITDRITIYYNSSIKSLGVCAANLPLKEFLCAVRG